MVRRIEIPRLPTNLRLHNGITWIAGAAICLCAYQSYAQSREPKFEAITWQGTIDPSYFYAATSDSKDRIWAIGRGYEPLGYICAWDAPHWRRAVPPMENLEPHTLLQKSNGNVLCIWRPSPMFGGPMRGFPDTTWVVTELEFDRLKVVTQFDGDHLGFGRNMPGEFFLDSGDVLWTSNLKGEVWQIDLLGTVEKAFQLTPEQYGSYNPAIPAERRDGLATLTIVEAAPGDLWFWAGRVSITLNTVPLKGMVRFSGDAPTHFPSLPGLGEGRLSALEAMDERTLLASVREDGLYKIDLDTLQATRVREPERGAFRMVRDIVNRDGNIYLYAQGESSRRLNLWKLDDKTWRKVLGDIASTNRSEPPFVETSSGHWVGAWNEGLWHVPAGRNKEPTLLHWRDGLPQTQISDIRAIGDDGLLLLTSRQRYSLVSTKKLLEDPPAAISFRVSMERELVTGPEDRLWGIRYLSEGKLVMWDGDRWEEIEFPFDINVFSRPELAVDSLGRVWVRETSPRLGSTAVYDYDQDAWTTYETFHGALERQMSLGKKLSFGDPETRPNPSNPWSVSISEDGRAAFLDAGELHYFNGLRWRIIRAQEIGQSGLGLWYGPPLLSEADSVSIYGTPRDGSPESTITLRFEDGKDEPHASYSQAERTATQLLARPYLEIFECCELELSELRSIVRDKNDVSWILSGGKLYKAAFGLCVPVFASDDVDPIAGSPFLSHALLDRRGRTFLLAVEHNKFIYYVIESPDMNIDTELALEGPSSDGTVRLAVSSPEYENAWYQWRLNDGAWSDAGLEKVIEFADLQEGAHTVEVRAIGPMLSADSTPAASSFEIRIEPSTIEGWIKTLVSGDHDAREAAARFLIGKPTRALPELRKARASTSADDMWWIDAVIERIRERAGSEDEAGR